MSQQHRSTLRSTTLRTVSIATIGLTLANVDAVQALTIILGTAGPDVLIGTSGDDSINGRGGADVMIGLAGNDTYIVNDEADQVVEQANEGVDTVRVHGWYVLPANVNNLVVAGTQDGGGLGNNRGNRMIGNSGYNTLDGGPGNDILTGGGGRDIFRFTTALNASTNVDRVTDFTVGEDSLWLWSRVFPAFLKCTASNPFLDGRVFHIGGSSTTPLHRILYNPSTGGLYYDSDGSGPTPPVRFARLSPDLALTNHDFLVNSRTICP